MEIDYSRYSFKDFENIPNLDIHERATPQKYVDHLREKGFMNYRLLSTSPCGPEIELAEQGYIKRKVC